MAESGLSVRRRLREIKFSRSSFYRWCRACKQKGLDGLENQGRAARQDWNRIPVSVRELVVQVALDHPDLTLTELACYLMDTHDYFFSDSCVYHVFSAYDLVFSPRFIVISHLAGSSTRPVRYRCCSRLALPISES